MSRGQAIDDARARASLSAGTTTISLEFRFGSDGLIASVFAPDRFYDDGRQSPVPRPWLAQNLRYEERHGMNLPAAAAVEWELPEGVFPYWRGQLLAIEYELASP